MLDSDNNNLNMQRMRERLEGKSGRQYWRSLEELADTEEFQKFVEDEFPNRSTLLNVDRRTFLKYMGASMALAGLAGCRYLPEEHIVPMLSSRKNTFSATRCGMQRPLSLAGMPSALLLPAMNGVPPRSKETPTVRLG